MTALQKPQNLIPLKKPEMQGSKFSRNEEGESRFVLAAYAAAWTGKLKHKSVELPICTAEGSPEGVVSKDGRHARRENRVF